MILYEKVHAQDSMRQKEQESHMQKYFYGEAASLSYLELFLKGQGIFESMFLAGPGGMKLKPIYARSSKDYILGGNINKDILERVSLSKIEVVTGRYLRSCAAEGGCEARKSLPFLFKYLDEETGKPIRSGDEIEDVVCKWLDDFYVYCQSGTVTSPEKILPNNNRCDQDGVLQSSDDDEETPEVRDDSPNATSCPSTPPSKVRNELGDVIITIPPRPSDWFFPGFMFVLLFGPFQENLEAKRSMDFFLNRDPAVQSSSDKKAYGRSKMREKVIDLSGSVPGDFSTSSNNRAIPIAEELKIIQLEFTQATLQMQISRNVMQNFETKLMAKKMELDGIASLMEAASQMARATNDWSTWQRLFQQYETCQQEMREMNKHHEAQKESIEEVRIPSLAGLKRPRDDELPVTEINTEPSSSSSQLSTPENRSTTFRIVKNTNNNK